MYCVTVIFDIEPDQFDAFLLLVRQQAVNSLGRESGCRQFDVWTDPMRPSQVYLYETYDSPAAFDEHRSSPHDAEFSRAVELMVVTKAVNTWDTRQ